MTIAISSEPITDMKILEAEKKLKNKFTSGSDKIPIFFLKNCMRALLYPLRINLILKATTFPDE